jgi:hypothetical protein
MEGELDWFAPIFDGSVGIINPEFQRIESFF